MIRFGALCWSQSAEWKLLEDAGRRADRLGFDTLWTWDHLIAISGSPRGPMFEGWMTLGAWAASTSRVRLGLMVGANTFRHPSLVAKLATTLDHISGGRAVLGLGGAWSEREHGAYGMDFGSSTGERLRRLDDAVHVIRELLDGRPAPEVAHYALHGARLSPPPVQRHLPILVGGAGERRTLRTVARYADAWNVSGDPGRVEHKDAVLRAHCLDLGRDQAEIERTVGLGVVVLRRDTAAARRELRRLAALNGIRGRYALRAWARRFIARAHPAMWRDDMVGTPAEVVDRLRPYLRLGFRHFIVGLPAPYDAETMERLAAEVRPALEREVTAEAGA